MNNTLKIVSIGVVGVIVGIIASILFSISRPVQIVTVPVGGNTNYGGVITTSGFLATTTAAGTIATGGGSFTMIASDIVGYNHISITPIVASTTLILPASTTLTTAGFLPNIGDSTMFSVFNATTSNLVALGIKGGTGSLLDAATTTASTAASIASTTAGDSLLIRAVRKADTDIVFQIIQFH